MLSTYNTYLFLFVFKPNWLELCLLCTQKGSLNSRFISILVQKTTSFFHILPDLKDGMYRFRYIFHKMLVYTQGPIFYFFDGRGLSVFIVDKIVIPVYYFLLFLSYQMVVINQLIHLCWHNCCYDTSLSFPQFQGFFCIIESATKCLLPR